MNLTYIVVAAVAALVSLMVGLLILKKRPRKVNVVDCTQRWQALQKNCADKKSWHVAIIEADKLLDDVLKRRQFKGKTTGERLVSAQHDFTNNESIWFGRKLCNRIKDDGLTKLTKRDTLEALGGFRQALKDLGALQDKIITAPPAPAPETVIVEPTSKRPDGDMPQAVEPDTKRSTTRKKV